jgi:hypothetical protein
MTIRSRRNAFKSLIASGLLLVLGISPAKAFDNTHRVFTKELAKYVEGGSVHYSRWQKHPLELEKYIDSLAQITPAEYQSLSTEDKKALWLNAYNAATIKVILAHYPIHGKNSYYPANSLRQIPDVWESFHFKIANRDVDLDDLEHDIIRREFHDSRMHFGVVCAKGSAPLLPYAYVGARLNELLDRQTSLFLSDPRNVKFDPAKHTLQVTKLFSWFLLDFTPPGFFKGRRTPPSDDEIVIAYLEQSGPKELKSQLSSLHKSKEIKVSFMPFDWSLNDADASH